MDGLSGGASILKSWFKVVVDLEKTTWHGVMFPSVVAGFFSTPQKFEETKSKKSRILEKSLKTIFSPLVHTTN